MGIRLIPRDINIYEQFARRDNFFKMIERWCGHNPVYNTINLDQLEQASGVRCFYVGQNLAGFEIVNTKAYSWFVLKWS